MDKDENEAKYHASKLEVAGSGLVGDIVQLLRFSGISDICYAYKLRVKKESKLIEKLKRKQEAKSEYSLHDITDVVGLRLVALFKSDMVDLFSRIIDATRHRVNMQPNPFVNGSCQEIIVYKGASAFDDLTPQIREIAQSAYPGLQVKDSHSKEGYSSIHLVSRLNSVVECMRRDKDEHFVPIEIQVRTVFEDAWGEIDHKFGYTIRSGKEVCLRISNPEAVQGHLKVLKKFADGCVEYAECIRQNALASESVDVGIEVASTTPISAPSDDDILRRLTQLGIPEDFMGRFEDLRESKELLTSPARVDEKGSIDCAGLVGLAEQFRALGSDIESFEDKDLASGLKLLTYYVKMNEALCLMCTGEREYVSAAYHIYVQLHSEFHDFPFLIMRTGQALSKLGRIDEALEALRRAGEAAREIASKVGGAGEVWPDELPHVDYEHMQRSQPKLLGYALWQKGALIDPNDHSGKIAVFVEAYDETRKCLDAPDGGGDYLLNIHNNLLYYAAGFAFHAEKLPRDHRRRTLPFQ